MDDTLTYRRHAEALANVIDVFTVPDKVRWLYLQSVAASRGCPPSIPSPIFKSTRFGNVLHDADPLTSGRCKKSVVEILKAWAADFAKHAKITPVYKGPVLFGGPASGPVHVSSKLATRYCEAVGQEDSRTAEIEGDDYRHDVCYARLKEALSLSLVYQRRAIEVFDQAQNSAAGFDEDSTKVIADLLSRHSRNTGLGALWEFLPSEARFAQEMLKHNVALGARNVEKMLAALDQKYAAARAK